MCVCVMFLIYESSKIAYQIYPTVTNRIRIPTMDAAKELGWE